MPVLVSIGNGVRGINAHDQAQMAPAQCSSQRGENCLIRNTQVKLPTVVKIGIRKPFAKIRRQRHQEVFDQARVSGSCTAHMIDPHGQGRWLVAVRCRKWLIRRMLKDF